ncbi:MAG: hypothetical protein ACF8OB_01800, partial [Phycisphaeraceae bacterium JB051]
MRYRFVIGSLARTHFYAEDDTLPANIEHHHEVNAADFGFLPTASGMENARALQKAVDQQGTIIVSRPGVYDLADTVFLPSHTD